MSFLPVVNEFISPRSRLFLRQIVLYAVFHCLRLTVLLRINHLIHTNLELLKVFLTPLFLVVHGESKDQIIFLWFLPSIFIQVVDLIALLRASAYCNILHKLF